MQRCSRGVPSRARAAIKTAEGQAGESEPQRRQKKDDAEEIRTLACRAHFLSRETPSPFVSKNFNHSATASVTDAGIGGKKKKSQNFSVIFSPREKPVFQYLTRGAPGHRRIKNAKNAARATARTRSHHSREAAASRARLRGETTTTTCPPKNGRAVLIRRATRVLLFVAARSGGAP